MDGLYQRGCPVCGGNHDIINISDEPTPEMRKEAERIAKGIYDGSIKSGTIDPALTKLVAEEFRNAVIKGWEQDLPSIKYDTTDYAKLANIERNVYQFSAAKDYQQLKSMTLALKDGDRIRTFTEFRNESLKISDVYVGAWLHTEYNTAVSGAQMAAKWNRFYADKDIAPLLKYRTVGDERVRPAHQELDGIIKKVEDPFWDDYFPPNGWNCRCDVIQLLTGSATSDDKTPVPDDVPKMFRTNMAKQGIVFPASSPYYIDLPKEILMQGERLLAQRILNWAKQKLAGQTVTAPTIGEVEFGTNGIKELLNQPHKFYTDKNQAVYALKNIVANAKYVSTQPDEKGKVKQYHYLKITIKGKPSFVVIRESFNGKKYVYSIVDKLKK